MSRFLNSAGQIDETAIAAAADADAATYSYRTGREFTAAQRAGSLACFRRDANIELAIRHGFTEQQFLAAECFVAGALAGLAGPIDMSDFRDPAWVRDSFDRQSAWNTECARKECDARLAVLDRSLARIAASRDITQFLEAAE